jgi:hypothetical protein
MPRYPVPDEAFEVLLLEQSNVFTHSQGLAFGATRVGSEPKSPRAAGSDWTTPSSWRTTVT